MARAEAGRLQESEGEVAAETRELKDVHHSLWERTFYCGFNAFPLVLYFGNWNAATPGHGGTAGTCSNTQYNAFEFSFRGPEVRWIGSVGPDHGHADVYIDNELVRTVDTYAAQAKDDVVVFETGGLSRDRIHTLRAVVKKERNRKATDCYQQVSLLQAETPVIYPLEISTAMAREYAVIEAGEKVPLPPESWEPVEFRAYAPQTGVILESGPIYDAFVRNIAYLNHSFASPTLCDGKGWSQWLPASNEGRLLQGAGNTLRWVEREDMRNIVDTLVDRIASRFRDDGYYGYYAESDSYALDTGVNSERKNYDRVFWTRGLLSAGMAGNQEAYELVRRMYDWFNSCRYLPRVLHSGNATNGLPGGPLVYLSPVGTREDLITTMRYYDQEYWLSELTNREPLCLSHYPGERPHCYDLLGIEAFVDEYRATGARKYLDAVLGAWDIYRENYKHIGGATSIMESTEVFPPKSYHFEQRRIGETCGSVFWIYINSRLHQLFPDEERYTAEIEEAIFNVNLANQDEKGYIRYHTSLQGTKTSAGCLNTCCEVSSAGLLARLPEFVYSLAPDGLYVNLFTSSQVTWQHDGARVSVTAETDFPQRPDVKLGISVGERPAVDMTLHIRVPSWATSRMFASVNGAKTVSGEPGTYLAIRREWRDDESVTFTLPIGFRMAQYTGLDQIDGNLDRYALLYGPLLMALVGPLEGPGGVPRIAETPEKLPGMLTPADGRSLAHTIAGYPGYSYKPYWQLNDETFTCFPVVEP